MKRTGKRYCCVYTLLVTALIWLLIWNIAAGSVGITLSELIHILEGEPLDNARIVWDIRMPRALAALMLGGALAVSGFLLQTFFANPIAGPFVLGISSGAKLAVALTMVFSLSRGYIYGSFALVLAAFAGAMLSMGFILMISRYVIQSSMLVVGGVMIGYICSAITDFIVTFANDANIVNLHNWSLGSFSGMSWNNMAVISVVSGISLMLTFSLSKPIGAYQMGEVYAKNMGVNITALRTALILLSSILSACATAFAGPVSFVGIAVPHLVRGIFRTAKPLIIIPGCFLGGAVSCLFCDLVARTALAPTELNISSVTALFGAPIVVYIMAHRKAQKGWRS